jgi:ABC-type amino acid transport substrate-binding protein
MEYLFKLFSEFVPVPTAEAIYAFCHDHFVLAWIIGFGVLLIAGVVVLSSLTEIAHGLSRLLSARLGIWIVVIFGVGGVILSTLSVFFILRLLEPVPVLDTKRVDFLREPVVLTWTYKGESPNEPVVYQIQQASGSSFNARGAGDPGYKIQRAGNPSFNIQQAGDLSSGDGDFHTTDGTSFYSYQATKEQWWRVRPGNTVNSQFVPLTGWSKPIKTTYYVSSYHRIESTGRVRTYVSNSYTQGIFKFLNDKGELTGVDIELATRITNALLTETNHEIQPPKLMPVAWVYLMQQPGSGAADLIISSITKRESRETKYGIGFSNPYFCTGQSLVWRKGEWGADVPVAEMLKGKTVGYQIDTTSETLVEGLIKKNGEHFFAVHKFNEAENMIQYLRNPSSNVQIVVTDTPFALDAVLHKELDAVLHKEGGSDLVSKPVVPSDYPDNVPPEERVDAYAIAVAQGETRLRNSINSVIAQLKATKALAGILEKAATAKYPQIDPATRAQLYASSCP